MDQFLFFVELGFNHVMDLGGLDHFYFIAALTLPFGFMEYRKLLWWVTLFTIGHTLSLIGNYYAQIPFSAYWIELLIPITIAFSCLPLLFHELLNQRFSVGLFPSVLTLVFGVIHGLGFGRYFGMLVPEGGVSVSLFSFAVGVEMAQLFIVMITLLLNTLVVSRWKTAKTPWLLFTGALILSQALSMIAERVGGGA